MSGIFKLSVFTFLHSAPGARGSLVFHSVAHDAHYDNLILLERLVVPSALSWRLALPGNNL